MYKLTQHGRKLCQFRTIAQCAAWARRTGYTAADVIISYDHSLINANEWAVE